MKLFVRVLVPFGLAFVAPLCAQTSLAAKFGGAAGLETSDDRMIFANGPFTATATAWSISRTGAAPRFQESEIVQWSPGIGVKNSAEFITDTPYVPYYVDNEDHYDFVLFLFSQPLELTSVSITPSAGTFDLDVSYFFGNVDPLVTLTGKSFAELSSLGFGPRMDSDAAASNSPRTVGLTTPAGGVNALLFGARVNGDANYDRFKISAIGGVTMVPEPSSAGLLLGSVALLLARRRR